MRTMKTNVEFLVLDDLQLVRINITGSLSAADLDEVVGEASSISGARSYNRFYDFRSCIVKMSVLELYEFPRLSSHMNSIRSKTVQVALLVNQDEGYGKFKFYETTATNVGFNIKVFTKEPAALAWLSNS